MAEVAPDKSDKPDKSDPVVEHFIELRKYIEHSHDGLSNRLENVEGGLQRLEGRQDKVEGRLERLERKVDAGFDRVGRKIDALGSVRRGAPRRRKP